MTARGIAADDLVEHVPLPHVGCDANTPRGSVGDEFVQFASRGDFGTCMAVSAQGWGEQNGKTVVWGRGGGQYAPKKERRTATTSAARRATRLWRESMEAASKQLSMTCEPVAVPGQSVTEIQ